MNKFKFCLTLIIALVATSWNFADGGTFIPPNGYVFDAAHQHPDDLVWMFGNSTATLVPGGLIGSYVRLFDTSTFNMTGGTLNSYLYLGNDSNANLSGGLINGDIRTDGTSHMSVIGGNSGYFIVADGSSVVDVYGGSTLRLAVDRTAVINVYGTNLFKDTTTQTITGTLADGTPINASYLYQSLTGQINLITVPEPSTLILCGLSAIGLVAIARRRK